MNENCHTRNVTIDLSIVIFLGDINSNIFFFVVDTLNRLYRVNFMDFLLYPFPKNILLFCDKVTFGLIELEFSLTN